MKKTNVPVNVDMLSVVAEGGTTKINPFFRFLVRVRFTLYGIRDLRQQLTHAICLAKTKQMICHELMIENRLNN